MVAPLIIAAGVAAVAQIGSAIMQWKSSQAAQTATAAEHAKMDELLSKIQEPGFDLSQIQPEEFKVVGKYIPQVAQVISEKAPEVVKRTSEMERSRGVQNTVLDRLMAQTQGNDPTFDSDLSRAQRSAASAGQSQRATAMEQGQRQGMAPSMMGYANALGGMADSQLQAAMMGEQGARDKQSRASQAMGQASGLAGQMYGQDYDQEKANADIINSFNQRLAGRQQDWENQRTLNANAAQQYNLGAEQNTSNANVGARNDAAVNNRNYGNQIKQQAYNNQMDKLRVQGGQSAQASQNALANAAQNNQMYSGVAGAIGQGAMAYGNYDQNETDKANAAIEAEKNRQAWAKMGGKN